jgi:AraC-like DNA-binding protein
VFCKELSIIPALKDLVHCLLFIQQECPKDKALLYFHPPTPQSGICFHFQHSVAVYESATQTFINQPQTVVVGPQISPVLIQSQGRYSAVRVGLLPGALYRLTGISQDQMLDQSFDAELIFGNELKTLNQVLKQTTFPETALHLIEQFLLNQLSKCRAKHSLDEVMHHLWSQPDALKVRQLATESGLCIRQFERISHQRIGMQPKLYHKIIRFSKAYQMVEQGAYNNWTDLAYKNNYYDRQHLKKDFKYFTGKNLIDLHYEIASASMLIQSKLRYE